MPPLPSKWTQPVLTPNSHMSFTINCIVPSLSWKRSPSCMCTHFLWPWYNVTRMSWADQSAQLCRCKAFSLVWEENIGFSHKACIQQNVTIDKHLVTFIPESICLLRSLRKELLIIPHKITKLLIEFIIPSSLQIIWILMNQICWENKQGMSIFITVIWKVSQLPHRHCFVPLMKWLFCETWDDAHRTSSCIISVHGQGVCQFLSLLLFTEVCALSPHNIFLFLDPL